MADWRIVSEKEPDENYKNIGQMWIKPSTGTAYLWLGKWVAFAGGNPINLNVPLTLIARGQNMTEYTTGELDKEDAITSQVDSCSFEMEDIKLKEGEEIFWFYKKDKNSEAEKIFAGNVVNIPEIERGEGTRKYIYQVEAVDYSGLLNKRLVVETYENKTCKEIISDLVDKYAPDFSIHNVETGFIVDYISWNYVPVSECLRELVEISNGTYDWFVDENKNIHFFQKSIKEPAFIINEDTYTDYRNLTIEIDKSQLRNRIYVRGGYYLSNDFTQEIVADGKQREFLLAYSPRVASSGNVEVYVNGVQKTVGIDHINTSGYDFVVNYTDKLIKNLDYPTLANGDILKVVYRYEIPILVAEDDESSQELMRQIEGGTGIYEHIIVDTSIETIEQAEKVADSELEKYSYPLIRGHFITNKFGYRSGQIIYVDLPSRNIKMNFVITSVRVRTIAKELEYVVEFENIKSKKFLELMVELIDKKQEVVRRKDEVLQELTKKRDSAKIKEVGLNFSEPPSEWDVSKWDEFEWK